eukprot:g214.t1
MSSSRMNIKRIMADLKELAKHPSPLFHAAPRDDDLFDWHFTIRGPEGTDFEGGLYHGRILLSHDYPFKAPSIVMLTPSGRFTVGEKICLSLSAYHPETWQPAWGIRTILEALVSFFPSPHEGSIGTIDVPSFERKKLAKRSVQWKCPQCGPIIKHIPEANMKISHTASASNGKKKSTPKLFTHAPAPQKKITDEDEAKTKDTTTIENSFQKHKQSTTAVNRNEIAKNVQKVGTAKKISKVATDPLGTDETINTSSNMSSSSNSRGSTNETNINETNRLPGKTTTTTTDEKIKTTRKQPSQNSRPQGRAEGTSEEAARDSQRNDEEDELEYAVRNRAGDLLLQQRRLSEWRTSLVRLDTILHYVSVVSFFLFTVLMIKKNITSDGMQLMYDEFNDEF